jgi:Spy/CpxP family protein refolding chaperone
MDLTNQSKFKNLTIAALLLINFLLLIILWVQISKKNEQTVQSPVHNPSETVSLFKRELSLTREQTEQMEKIHADKVAELKKCNDSLDNLKNQFVDLLAQPKPDQSTIDGLIQQISNMESITETHRLQLFSKLNELCTPEQKQKLHPIVADLFGKKNDKKRDDRPKNAPQKTIREPEQGQPENPENHRPPQPAEKVQKLAERLQLSEAQKQKITDIITMYEKQREALKNIPHPDKNQIETEKQNIRKNEDQSIMQVLTPEQRNVFNKMIEKRHNPENKEHK